jgi:hypothetical protein
MKYYTVYDRISLVEVPHSELLLAVDFGKFSRSIKANVWGNAWIYEADEYFQTYCVMRWGFKPPIITEIEYSDLIRDGVTFLSKARTHEIRQALDALTPAW